MGIHLQVTGNMAHGTGARNGDGGGIYAVGVFTMTDTKVAIIIQGVTFKSPTKLPKHVKAFGPV